MNPLRSALLLCGFLAVAGCAVPNIADVDLYTCPWLELDTNEPQLSLGSCVRVDVVADAAVRTVDTFDNYPEDGTDETAELSCSDWTTCATASPNGGELVAIAGQHGVPGELAVSYWRCDELPPCSVPYDPAWSD